MAAPSRTVASPAGVVAPAAAGASKVASAASRLTCDEVAAYQRDGFLLPGFRLEPSELAAGRRAMDEILAKNPGVMPEQLVNAHLVDGDGAAQGVRGCEEFLALASHPGIVGLVSQCLGTENVILWACQIFCKLPGEGKAVPYHQDGQYWPIEPLRACSAWIALDDSDAENGALEVVPGTHHQGCIEHVQRVDEEACISYIADPALVEPLLPQARTLELSAGQVSLHDSMLLHGSGTNKSQRRRAGVAAAYMPAECHFNRDVEPEGSRRGGLRLDFSHRPLFVVQGSNQHPQNTLLRTV